ncbi:MAG: AAA family ATPase [Chloroflexi bacterium]|nr:AAA family ATPase [Chloroflexota bacterium]
MSTRATPFKDQDFDELDRKIDDFLSRAGAILRFLAFVAVLGAFLYFVLIPNWDTAGPILLLILSFVVQIVLTIFIVIVQFVAIFWFLGKPRIYWVMPGETGVGFKDYKGNPEVLEAAKQVVTLLRGMKEFKEMGGDPIRGLLLVGNPGTGKSYLAQCIATEAGVPFGYLSAPSIMGMFWGMDMLRVMTLYGKARGLANKYGACILFIDEIDAIGRARYGAGAMGAAPTMMGMGGMGNGGLNELLNQMDPLPRDTWKNRILRKLGLRTKKAEMKPVLTMAATNIAEILDPALLRPGRFDRRVTVDVPDDTGRREILEYYLAKIRHEPMPVDRMVGDTIGYTPVAIKYVLNEAAVVATWDNRDTITYQDWSTALENHEFGLRQPNKSMTLEDRRRLAYHETGHAIAMVKLLSRSRLHKVTIVRHSSVEGALGFAAPKPNEEINTETKEEILARIQISLASRAAEQLFLGIEMTGARGDLANATRLATLVITYYGMNGTLYQAEAVGQTVPDAQAKREIEKLLDQQFKRVKQLLEDNRDVVIAVAEELLAKHDLTGDEVVEIVRRTEGQRGQAPVPALPSTNGHTPSESDTPIITGGVSEGM